MVMLLTKVCQVLLLASLVTSAVVRDEEVEDYILPDNYEVSEYKIDLVVLKEVFEGKSTAFKGYVEIIFQFKKEATTVQLHAPFENINSLVLKDNKTITTSHKLNLVTSILTITPSSTLDIKSKYTLAINYTGTLEITSMHGFYLSSYEDDANVTHFLVTTQFEPVHARKAFPCFDEPKYKATFAISITYPKGYNAYSNTPREGQLVISGDTQKETFKITPKMSTYLIAFTVSEFTCDTGKPISTGLSHRVCSRIGTETERSLAVQYGTIIMQTLETLTDIPFSQHFIGKIDQLAIPDFSAGAMENYGLVTYREAALLWSETESSNINKQRVLTVIAHEFAHMWFGDLVTLEWWDYTFLNEGFARFFEYYTFAEITELDTTENWQITKQFVVEQHQSAFAADSLASSLSLTSQTKTPEDISNKFNSIGYNKGASVIRMLYNIVGSGNFQQCIRRYLIDNQHKNTNPTTLWTAFKRITNLDKLLPESVEFDDVVDSWINKPGYPVVTVSAKGNDITLHQERFLFDEGDDEEDNEWYIPISYTLSNNTEDFEDVTPKVWLEPDNDLTIEGVLEGNDWIILNNQESAYYRVNYDSNLWSKIKKILESDHTKIDVLNRAQIVDDVFNLAKANLVKYSEAFDTIKFLKYEEEYYPWYSALNGFNSLTKTFGQSSKIGTYLNILQLDLLQKVYKSAPIDKLNVKDQIYTLKQVKVLEQMCKLGEESCISSTKTLFAKIKSGESINANLKNVVYCNGLRYSEDIKTDWQFLWDKYENSNIATEQITILSALGCTEDSDHLKKYLQLSITADSGIRYQDLSTVWSSVINSHSGGVNAALDFFIDKYTDIIAHDSRGGISTLLMIASSFTEQSQIDKLEKFSKTEELDNAIKTAAESSITTAKTNLNWVSKVKDQFESYFNTKGAAPQKIANIFNIILLLSISILFLY